MAIIVLDTIIMYIMITSYSAFKVDSMFNSWVIWIDQLIQQSQQNISNVDTAYISAKTVVKLISKMGLYDWHLCDPHFLVLTPFGVPSHNE